jgi:hypothetical protein
VGGHWLVAGGWWVACSVVSVASVEPVASTVASGLACSVASTVAGGLDGGHPLGGWDPENGRRLGRAERRAKILEFSVSDVCRRRQVCFAPMESSDLGVCWSCSCARAGWVVAVVMALAYATMTSLKTSPVIGFSLLGVGTRHSSGNEFQIARCCFAILASLVVSFFAG